MRTHAGQPSSRASPGRALRKAPPAGCPSGGGLPKRQWGFARRAGSASAGPGSTGALPQVGHKRRPMALRTAYPARRRAARFPRPGISPGARGAEGGKAAPGVPQGAFCGQLAGRPPARPLSRLRRGPCQRWFNSGRGSGWREITEIGRLGGAWGADGRFRSRKGRSRSAEISLRALLAPLSFRFR